MSNGGYWSPRDIQGHYGVTRAAVVQWRKQPSFPAPAFHVSNGVIPVYSEKEVRSWAAGRKKRSRKQKDTTAKMRAAPKRASKRPSRPASLSAVGCLGSGVQGPENGLEQQGLANIVETARNDPDGIRLDGRAAAVGLDLTALEGPREVA